MKKLFPILSLTLLALSPAFAGEKNFGEFLEHYSAIHAALAGDSMDGVAGHATALAKAARHMSKHDQERHGEHGMHGEMASSQADQMRLLMAELASAADEMAGAADISVARSAFGKLSQAMIKWRGSIDGEKPHVFFCPMIKQSWLQTAEQAANPYFGKKMLKCGQIVEQ